MLLPELVLELVGVVPGGPGGGDVAEASASSAIMRRRLLVASARACIAFSLALRFFAATEIDESL